MRARSTDLDQVICRKMNYECEIGFHSCELRMPQRIRLDLQAWVRPISLEESDRPEAIRFDYYEANKDLRALLLSKQFNLIETLAETIAERLLKKFRIEAIEVELTKYPLDMPNVEEVAYRCYRERAAGGENAG